MFQGIARAVASRVQRPLAFVSQPPTLVAVAAKCQVVSARQAQVHWELETAVREAESAFADQDPGLGSAR